MKKTLCCIFAAVLLAAFLAGCGAGGSGSETPGSASVGSGESQTDAGKGGAKEFTAPVRLETDYVEFCLPEDHDGVSFTDMGANCVLMIDRYGNDVAAYHEYDRYGEIQKKTVGGYTFDYQKFNYMDLPNWRIYVIRIFHNGDYYRFLYNVYATEYDDAQVEKFMGTIRFVS